MNSDLDFDSAAAEVASQARVQQPAAQAPPQDAPDLDFSAAARSVAAELPHQQAQQSAVDLAADEKRKADLLRWRVLNEDRAPEEQAEVLKMSAALGWNPDVVAGDMQKARNAVEASGMDAEGVVRAHPALADFIGDPQTSALARSDTARLTGLSYLIGQGATPGAVSLWLQQRSLARDTHDLQAQLLKGTTTDENAAPEPVTNGSGDVVGYKKPERPLTAKEESDLSASIEKNEKQLRHLSAFGDGVNELGWGGKKLAQTAKLLIDMGPEMAKGAAVSALGALAGGATGVATGTAFWASETAPSLFWQLRQWKKADGTPVLTDDEARDYSRAGAIPIGAMNTALLDGIGASVGKWATSQPVAEKALSALIPDAFTSLMARKTLPAAIERAALHYGTHAVQGGLLMAGQSALTQATMELAGATHGTDAPGTVSDAVFNGFAQGINDFALISAWGPVRKLFAEQGGIAKAQENAQVFRDIAENTRDSKLAQRSPEKFEELVKRFDPSKTVYVTRERFNEYSQEAKRDPRELAAEIVGDKGEAYDAAVQSGGDVAIPASRWASKAVLDGHAAKLQDDARFNLDEPTARQASDRLREINKEVQERAKQRGPAFENEVADLKKRLFEGAQAAGYGRDQADSWSDVLSKNSATMSLRLDVPLREAVVRTGLPTLRLEGREALGGKLVEALKLTPEEQALASGHLDQRMYAGYGNVFHEPFDFTKIGTGAGTLQGYGRYLSIAKDVANSYRAMSAEETVGPNGERKLGGMTVTAEGPENDKLLHSDKTMAEQPAHVMASLKDSGLLPKDFEPGEMTGEQFYDKLSQDFGNARYASHALADVGIPGLTYESAMHGGAKNFLIWSPAHIKELAREYGESTLQGALPQKGTASVKMPKQASEKRGTIRFKVDGAGRSFDFDIHALHGDASTLAHETGHFLSWSLHDLAESKDAPQSIKDDYAALLKLGGWKDASERLSDNLERSKLAGEAEKLQAKIGRAEKGDQGTAELRDALAAKQARIHVLEAKEEKISHAWEQYLSEGKAPDAALARTFFRFRRWMGQVYSKLGGVAEQYRLAYGQNLWLSDEVRGVFNRMLAVDNTVDGMRQEDTRLNVAGVLRLTPEQRAREEQLREQKYAEARAGLDSVTAKSAQENGVQGVGVAAGGFLRAERERIRSEVHEDISNTSPYTAVDFFKTGEFRDENGRVFEASQLPEALKGEDGKPARLSFEEARKSVGAETAKLLKRKGLVSDKKGGISADEVASVFNFKDGKEMLESIAHAFDKDAVVEQETARRFDEVFGKKMHDIADQLSAVGADAMHNGADIQHALLVRDAIAREIGAPAKRGGKLPYEVLDMNAQRIIRGTRLKEISPKYYLDAERQQTREAKELLEKAFKAKEAGRLEEADALHGDALHKWDSVLTSKLLWRHAREALHDADGFEAKLERAAKTPWAMRLGKADPTLAYADANDTILGSVERKEGAEPRAEHIDQVLAAMQRDGADGIVQGPDGRLESTLWDSQLLRDLATKPGDFKDLTLSEAQEVNDAIDNIAATARERSKVRIGEQKMSMDEFMAALEESAKRLGPTNDPRDPKALNAAKSLVHKGAGLFQSIDANLTEIRSHIERLTAGDREHPLYKFFVTEREKARDRENRLLEKFGKSILEKWDNLPEEMRKRASEQVEERNTLPLPDTHRILDGNSPITRSYLWMIAMNLGNAGNKQRLLDGFGWSEKQVMDVLQKHLSGQEWRWIQGVWNSLGELYPELEKTHVLDTGLRPEKVEATPFTVKTADGETVEMQGGYFPIRYDPRVPTGNHLGEKQAESFTTQMPLHMRPKTAQGATKARAEEGQGLLHLNFDIVPGHVTQVIHDISHRIWVKEAARIVHDPRFEGIIKGSLGLAYESQFRSWVGAIANQFARTGVDTLGPINRFFSWAKSRATLASVGFNAAVPLTHITNVMNPVIQGDLSATKLAGTMRQLSTRWDEMRSFALENSIELRARQQHGANALGIDIPGLVKSKGMLGEVEHAAYWMLDAGDKATSTPVWLAKYWQGLEGGSDHETAVRDAEALVQKYFPASDMSSRAAILRDRGFLGSLTFLYGYGSKIWNLDRSIITKAVDSFKDENATAMGKTKAVGIALGTMLMQAAVMEGVGAFLGGHGPRSDQDNSSWIAERSLSFVTNQIPFFDLLFGGRAALPSSGLFAKMKHELTNVAEGNDGVAESIAALGGMAVYFTGANQFLRTGQYIDNSLSYDWRRGNMRRVASGLIYGNRDIVTPINIGEKQ